MAYCLSDNLYGWGYARTTWHIVYPIICMAGDMLGPHGICIVYSIICMAGDMPGPHGILSIDNLYGWGYARITWSIVNMITGIVG